MKNFNFKKVLNTKSSSLSLLVLLFLSIAINAQEKQDNSCNMIPGDSSFETGWGIWGKCGTIEKVSDAPDGKHCLKIRRGARTPQRFHLDKSKEYTFSCYLKADKPTSVCLGILRTDWSGNVTRKYIRLARQWKRYELKIPAQDVNDWVWLTIEGCPDLFYLDACQLEKGKLSAYKSAEPVTSSVSLECPVEGNIFYPDEEIKINFNFYNSRKNDEAVNLFYIVKNYYGEIIKKENVPITILPESNYLYPVSLDPLTKKGFYIINFNILRNKEISPEKSASFCVVAKPLPYSPREGSLFGVSYMRYKRVPAGERIGIKWSNVLLLWANLERVKGQYNFTGVEKLVDFMKKHNINLKGWLRRTPDWAGEYKDPTQRALPTLDAVPEYEKFVFETVSHFKDKIHYWNSWGGEFDIRVSRYAAKMGKSEDWVTARLVELMKAGYRGAKRADTACIFGDPVQPSGVECKQNFPYTRKVLALGGAYTDLLGLDCYTWPRYFKKGWKVESPEQGKLTKILKAGQALAGKRKCQIAEYGFALSGKEKMDSPSAKALADYMARSYILAASVPGIEILQWYACWSAIEGESSYDMWRWPNPLPVTAAYSALAQVLTGAVNPRQIPMGNYIRAYSFEKKGENIVCLWVPSDKKINIKLDVNGLKIIDIMGNEVHSPDGGLEISGSPVYLLAKMPIKKLSEVVAHASIDLIPATVELRLVDQSTLKLYLTSQTNKKLSGEIELEQPFRLKKHFTGLRPGVAESLAVLLPGKFDKSGKFAGIVKTNMGEVAFSQDMSLIPCIYMNKKVVIDGNLAEWEGRPYIELNNQDTLVPPDAAAHNLWTGEDDLSGKFYLGWDNSNFYFAAKVRDDCFINKQGKKRIWSGDSIQLAFNPENDAVESEAPGYEDDDKEFSFGFSQKTNKAVIYRHWPIPPADVPEARLTVKRERNHIIYELALPFSEIAPLKPREGKIFGCNFAVLDHDNTGGSYGMSFSPGVLGGKSPAMFKKFIFTKAKE